MLKELKEWLNVKKRKNRFIVIVIVIIALDVLVYSQIFTANFQNRDLRLYFLDVDQGDSELIILPGGVKMLVDGGPANGRVLEELGKLLPPTERYIDLVILSHPQLDHFGGLIEVLKRYRVGALIHNGRNGAAGAFGEFEKVIKENDIKTIRLAQGDKISYRDSFINVLSPDETFLKSKELNDTALVLELNSENAKSLFTGDIGFDVENKLLNIWTSDVDILKVAHHGSKFSSSADFLSAVRPKLAVIEVGRNSYGHPTFEALRRLSAAGAKIYRTDRDGTVKLVIDGRNIKIIK